MADEEFTESVSNDSVVEQVTDIVTPPTESAPEFTVEPTTDNSVTNHPAPESLLDETVSTETAPEVETEAESAVTESGDETVVAADSATNEVEKETTVTTNEPKPDVKPRRKLGWKGYILGGSGGTK